MAWIELHQAVFRHPKITRAAAVLGITRISLVGHIAALWCWALDAKQDGGPIDDVDVRIGAEWEQPGDLTAALVAVGLLEQRDGRLWIHDWDVYTGRLIRSRKAAAERAKASRDRSVARTPDGTFADRARTEPITYAHDRDSYPSTVPNPTQPEEQASNARARAPLRVVAGGWDGLPPAAGSAQRLLTLRCDLDARATRPREEVEIEDLAESLTPEDVAEVRRRSDGKPWNFALSIAGRAAADRRAGRDPWRDRVAAGAGGQDAGGAGRRGIRSAGNGRRPSTDGGAAAWQVIIDKQNAAEAAAAE